MTPTPLIRAFVCASFCGLALLEVRSRDAATFTPVIQAKIAAAPPADQALQANVNSVFLNPDGTVNPALMPDLIHPNADGAEAMAAAIKPTIDKLLP